MIISIYDTFHIEQLHSLHKKYAKNFPVHGKRKETFKPMFYSVSRKSYRTSLNI